MTFHDPWASVKLWRKRRAGYIAHPHKPTYDVYPEDEYDPEVKVYLEARDAKGRLLREYVYLEGYSLHQLNFKRGAKRGNQYVGEWVWDSMIVANALLAIRLHEVRKHRKGTPDV